MVDLNKQDMLEKHLNLVLQMNQTTNLTRITDVESAKILHIEDSLTGLPEVLDAIAGPYADLGTGAGFPGIPLAIETGRETVLVDSVKKKADCLDAIISELGLSAQVSTYWGRIEDYSLEKKEYFAVITARALSQLNSLMELSSPLLKKHGRLVCYKANVSDDELEKARQIEKRLGMKFVSRRDFVLSDGDTHRCIIVFEKVAKPSLKLPRRVGLAQKKPLS